MLLVVKGWRNHLAILRKNGFATMQLISKVTDINQTAAH